MSNKKNPYLIYSIRETEQKCGNCDWVPWDSQLEFDSITHECFEDQGE